MSSHEKNKPPRSLRNANLSSASKSSSSPIATPPRVALRKAHNDETSSLKSIQSSPEEVEEPAAESCCSAKDKTISSLEKEISIMEGEFERELTLLSRKENETSLFWQNKHSVLHQNFLKVDTEARLLRQEVKELGRGKEERERDVRTRISSLTLDRDAFREAYNEAMREMRAKEEEMAGLRETIGGLKVWVGKAGGVAGGGEQVADEVFGGGWRGLGNSLQNWVIVNFRRVRVDPSTADDVMKEQLLRLVPTYDTLATTSKIHFIQSLVSRLLVKNIFDAYFVGLSKENAEQLSNVEKYLCCSSTVETMNQWRSSTLSILQKDASQKLQEETQAIVDSVTKQVNDIMDSISDAQHTDTRDQSLQTLIHSSIELSRLLRVQKASFSIMMPIIEGHQQTMFDTKTMEDIGGEDEDTLDEREIYCVAFPGIVKAGDENGERPHLRNVIAKIRVLCAPD